MLLQRRSGWLLSSLKFIGNDPFDFMSNSTRSTTLNITVQSISLLAKDAELLKCMFEQTEGLSLSVTARSPYSRGLARFKCPGNDLPSVLGWSWISSYPMAIYLQF